MQQNINPENEIDKSTETNNTMNQKILKIKGKPFWLNISANKRKTYSRFKTQSQSSHLDDLFSDNHESKQQINPQDDQQSCAQSIQSFNQNYEEDFESYKSTINRQNNSERKLPFFHSNKSQGKNINLQMSRLQISILKTPQKRQNAMILKHKIVQSIHKRQKKNIKTEPAQKKQENFSITRQMFMNQNTMYLRNENEKVVRKIQELRKILPVMIKNEHELSQQQIQLNQLRDKINRILSVEYEFQLDQNKLEIKIHQKQLEHSIKEMLSSKHEKKPLTVINDHTIVPPSKIAVLREQLMNKIRLSCLRQEKNNHLTKKVNLYEEINEKISTKLRLQSFNTLQNRKSFLQWDLKRLKNQIDLKIIQEKVELQSLKDQIRLTDLQIATNNQILSKFQNYPLPGANFQIDDVPKVQPNPSAADQMREEIQLVQQKNKAVKTFVFKKKKMEAFYTPTKNTSNTAHTNNSFILQKQKSQQKHFSLLPSPSFSRVNKAKANCFDKQHSLRKKRELEQCNRNLNIRIKKSNFHHEDMSQELQELKL